MSEPQRRRMDSGGGSGTRHAAATSTVMTAAQLQLEVDALLRGHHVSRSSIAWSMDNLIAFASPVPDSSRLHPTGNGAGSAGADDGSRLGQRARVASQASSQRGVGARLARSADRSKDGQVKKGAQGPRDPSEDHAPSPNPATAEQQQADAHARAYEALLPPPAQSITLQHITGAVDAASSSSDGGRLRTGHGHRGTSATHKLFPSFALLPITSAVGPATLVSFSPSARTLIAYFPPLPLAKRVAAATRAGELAAAAQVHAQMHAHAQAQAQTQAQGAAANDVRGTGSGLSQGQGATGSVSTPAGGSTSAQAGAITGPTPILSTTPGQTSIVVHHSGPLAQPPPPSPSQVPTSLAPSAGKGRLCIWTLRSSCALNDWTLRQIILVDDDGDSDEQDGAESDTSRAGSRRPRPQPRRPSAPPGFLYVEGVSEPLPAPIPAAPLSAADAMLEGAAPGSAPIAVIEGPIRDIRWCDEGRKLFIDPDISPAPSKDVTKDDKVEGQESESIPESRSYVRDASRGPSFAKPDSTPFTTYRPQAQRGTLVDEEPEEACFLFTSTGTVSVLHRPPGPPTPKPNALAGLPSFSITSTTLFESDVVPLGGASNRLEDKGQRGGEARARRRIRHLAVGGVPDEPLLLVAFRFDAEPRGRDANGHGDSGAGLSGVPGGLAPGSSDAAKAADAAAAAGLVAQATVGLSNMDPSTTNDATAAASASDSDPLGLLSAATGCATTASTHLASFGFSGADGGLGLGLGLGLDELGLDGGWTTRAADEGELCCASLEGMIGLSELRLRTSGEEPALVVRPLDPLPVPSLHSVDQEQLPEEPRPASATCHDITHLDWLEHPSHAHGTLEGPSPLQLVIVSSHGQADAASQAQAGPEAGEGGDAMDVDPPQPQAVSMKMFSSVHKYLIQRQLDPLTEAFGSLECKKADLPPAKADWALSETASIALPDRIVLGTLRPQDVLQVGCLLLTVANGQSKPSEESSQGLESYRQQWLWLDPIALGTMDVVSASNIPVLPRRDQMSAWVPSPNKAWAARAIGSASQRRIQLLKLPPAPRIGAFDVADQLSILLGRAIRAGTSCDDVAALLPSIEDNEALLQVFDGALLCAQARTTRGPDPPRLAEIQKLVELYMIRRGMDVDTQRLFLELLLCLRLITLNDLGRKVPHLPFRFDAVWPLHAQLSWVLQLLNELCRTAVYLETEGYAAAPNGHVKEVSQENGASGPANSQASATTRPHFALPNPLLQLIVLPAPRALLVHIVQSLYRFAFWLVGDEVGPLPAAVLEFTKEAASASTKLGAKYRNLGVRNVAYTAAVSHHVLAWRKRQVSEGDLMPSVEAFQGPAGTTTIAQQFEHAADACRAILDASAVRLDKALAALEKVHKSISSSSGGSADRPAWWTELANASALVERDEYRSLAASWLDEEDGCDADLVPLFVAPEDLLDDVHALDRINVTAAATATRIPLIYPSKKTGQAQGQVDASPPSPPPPPAVPFRLMPGQDEVELGTLTLDVIRKTALNLPPHQQQHALTNGAGSTGANGNGGAGAGAGAGTGTSGVVKSCVRCGARTGTYELAPVLAKGLAPVEEAFRARCLCGGAWWLVPL